MSDEQIELLSKRSHTYDSYGAWEAQAGTYRRRTLDEINSAHGGGYSANTGLFKNGMSVNDIDAIYTQSSVSARNLIQRIKTELGLTEWPDGRKLEDVIKV